MCYASSCKEPQEQMHRYPCNVKHIQINANTSIYLRLQKFHAAKHNDIEVKRYPETAGKCVRIIAMVSFCIDRNEYCIKKKWYGLHLTRLTAKFICM